MKRKLRHIMPLCSAVLMVFVAIFVLLPRDVCIGQVVADTCQCAPSMSEQSGQCCCGLGKQVFGCGDHSDHLASHDSDASDSSSAPCFSVSSEHSQLKSAERTHTVSVIQAVVAVLPLPMEVTVGRQYVMAAVDDGRVPGRDDTHLHRENCVYLI